VSILLTLVLLIAAAIGLWALIAFFSALIRAGGFRALFRAWLDAVSGGRGQDKDY